MTKTCSKCAASNAEHAQFCGKCGASLCDNKPEKHSATERTPAEQAAEIVERTKIKTDELKVNTKKLWGNFTVSEKIIAVGAIAIFLSFFLPFISVSGRTSSPVGTSTWYDYLIPISALASLAVLYFSQGASNGNKILAARWQIVIGTFWTGTALLLVVIVSSILSAIQKSLGGFGAMFGASSGLDVNFGIGMYLLAAGAAAIAAGAFKLQRELLCGGRWK